VRPAPAPRGLEGVGSVLRVESEGGPKWLSLGLPQIREIRPTSIENRIEDHTVTETQITPEMTMEQVLTAAPAAQRALFQRYHVGGCSACAFQPTDTLGQVAKDHNILDVNEMIRTIMQAEELDGAIQVEPKLVKSWLEAKETFAFIDCRSPDEWKTGCVDGVEKLDYNDSEKYMSLPKEHKLVFLCNDGERSLQVASYFIGHKFEQVFAVRGGMDAWSDGVGGSTADND